MSEHPAVAFLTAALARAEETAKAASRDGAATWKTADHPSDTRAVIDDHGEAVVYDEGWPSEDQADHIALHDPAAVLLLVAGAWQILAEHASDGDARWPECVRCADGHEIEIGECRTVTVRDEVPYPCRTVRLLARAWGWTEEQHG